MDYSAYKFWFDLFQTIALILVGIQQWLYKRSSATTASITAIDKDFTDKFNALSNRITSIEEFTRHTPTHEDLGELHEKINGVSNQLNELNGNVKQLNQSLNRLYDHELSKGGK